MGRPTKEDVAKRAKTGGKTPRDGLAGDPHRPLYHFLPASDWMNDPNGLLQWNGTYHLFYQTNPNGPFHGTIHWGHAASEDLVYWKDLPIALAPTPGGPDEDGCYSGCAIDHDGTPTIIYTGVSGDKQLPCLAMSTDDLVTWKKFEGNPVIPAPPDDLELEGFRDHCVWKEGDTWYQIIGSGIKGVGGAALLYESRDLVHWEYLHPLLVGDKDAREPVWTGTMWECPELLPLGDEHVLVVSVYDEGSLCYPAYFTGTYKEKKFVPRSLGIVDHGGSFYAPQTMIDDQGRRIMWGWLREARSEEAQRAAGWSGVMSLPRLLSPRPDGRLGVEPVPELQALRGAHKRFTDLDLTSASSNLLEGVRDDCLEILAEFEPGDTAGVGLKVCRSTGGEEETLIVYDRENARLGINSERSSLSSGVDREARWAPLVLPEGETLKLRIFLDRSVVEVFANGHVCVTSRIYPSRNDSIGLDLFARGGTAKLKSLEVWEMRSIWTSAD